MALSDLQVRKLVPRESRFEVPDGGKGLFIRVTPKGAKTWVYRYRFQGIPRRMSLGSYPGVGLADARTKHAEAMQDLQQGIDPGLKAAQAKAKMKAAPTFEDLLEEFWKMELHAQPSGKERRRLVEKDVIKTWGRRKVSSITRRDAVLLLDGVRKRAPVGANRLLGILVRMFNFAAERGVIDHSPLSGMKRKKEKARARVLTDEEIKSLWNALDLERKDIDIYRPTKLALKMILLTGQRPGEVAAMRWDQLDKEWWTIPEEVYKTGEGNRVPILPMTSAAIEEARTYSGDTPFVFASSHDQKGEKGERRKGPLTVRALSNAIRRHRAEIGIPNHFTPHDLRRTLRTRLAELGIEDIVAEKVLGHKLQGVLAIYNRYSYDEEKRQALELWEKRLKQIVGIPAPTGKVIPLAKKRLAKGR
ncbi:MAG: integrase [Deltaproteobacteria bacterium HGW-Deltaproteobacteria-15]|jgi:integrase|nr:MAG: integrase [Deltaproteobacteria bacterium HGW-Deltaproteobacteria-15]